MAVRFQDLKEKQFVSTCSVSNAGPPRVTKHHGDVTRPQVAFDYLEWAAGIDIHNHVRQGTNAFEDVWKTKDRHTRQFSGVMSFVFTNASTTKYFCQKDLKHLTFKMMLANKMVTYTQDNLIQLRTGEVSTPEVVRERQHHPQKYKVKCEKFQKKCYYCQHGRAEPKRRNTSYFCQQCGDHYPLCAPTVRDCFILHEKYGLPAKRRFTNK